jgi:hypothetical protein
MNKAQLQTQNVCLGQNIVGQSNYGGYPTGVYPLRGDQSAYSYRAGLPQAGNCSIQGVSQPTTDWGFTQVVSQAMQQMVHVVQQMVQAVLGQVLQQIMGAFGFQTRGSTIMQEVPGSVSTQNVLPEQGLTYAQNVIDQERGELAEPESIFSGFFDKVKDYAPKVVDFFKGVWKNKDTIVSTVKDVWGAVSGLFS